MKFTPFLFVFIITLSLFSCKKSKFDSDKISIKFDDEKRFYLLHTPINYNELATQSLIIALHGGVGTPRNIEEQSGLSTLSDVEGFMVCYPQGLNRTWNAGGCCGKSQKKDRDDVGFISFLIDELLANYDINPERIYITGVSNGGFMSYRLACEIPEKITAIAPVAATQVFENCTPTEVVPIIHFQSYLDTSVPYLGGIGDGIADDYRAPLDSVFEAWSSINNCGITDSMVYSGSDYDHLTWTDCTDSTVMHLYLTHDGGHQWPMGTKPTNNSDEPSTAINANQLMWDFFKSYW